MSNILDSKDFGLKIYNRFPPKYREDDSNENLALKRYLESLSDGGFKYAIDELNGILSLKDPENTDEKVLPILFKQYGLEVFNGIPEYYLRYLLPKLGEAWSKKGTLSVIEFITSSLSGIKTSTDVRYDDDDNPIVDVKFEMDYNIGDYFPNSEDFKTLLTVNFLPFYCDLNIIYNYMFYDYLSLQLKETTDIVHIVTPYTEMAGIYNRNSKDYSKYSSVLGQAILGVSILGYYEKGVDFFEDNITETTEENVKLTNFVDSKTNVGYNVLNSTFYTNGCSSYDIISVDGERTVIIH